VDFAAEAEWRSLREKLWKPENALEPPRRNWAAVAAVLAVVGMGAYVLKLQSDLKAPRAGYHILLASAETRGSAESVERLSLQEVPDNFSLTLVKPPELNFPAYVAEISREKGSPVQTVKGLRYQEGEGVTLILSKDVFEPGMYKIVLLGLRDGRSNRVGRYLLSILP
jgi:hypothetical protein